MFTAAPQRLRVAAFPGAHSAPLYHALSSGLFGTADLDVDLWEVQSSHAQLAEWDADRLDVVHTAADHFVRAPRPVAGRVIWCEPMGELTVYARGDIAATDHSRARWAVDSADSGFALVLRSVVEDVTGIGIDPPSLVELGGTRQRFEALLAGQADGATLHNPFDVAAQNAGFQRIGGHRDVSADLMTSACVMTRGLAAAEAGRNYVEVLNTSRKELLALGPVYVKSLLIDRGLPTDGAGAASAGLFGDLGLAADPAPTMAGLQAVVELRRRFFPNWSASPELLESLLD